MKTFTKQELTEILRLHGMWLRDEDGGMRANLSNSNLSYSNLSNSNLSYSNLSYSNLSNSDLSYSNLSNSNLRNSNFSYSNLRYSDLSYSDLSYSNLSNSNFSNSDLRNSNLRYSNLRYSNLSYSNLRGCFGQNAWIKTLDTDSWGIAYTFDRLQIGCENHPITDWWEFDDERIKKMDNKALEWWLRWKPILQSIIKNNPALPANQKSKDTNGDR